MGKSSVSRLTYKLATTAAALSLLIAVPAQAATTLFTNGFENGFAGWTAAGNWLTSTKNVHGGSKKAEIKGSTGTSDDTLEAAVSTATYGKIVLKYWYQISSALESADYVKVQWSSDNGTSWTTLATYTNQSNSGYAQATHSFTVPSSAQNTAQFKFRFLAKLDGTSDVFRLDDVSVTGETIVAENTLALCSDSIDNDFDGYKDYFDTKCADYTPKVNVITVVNNRYISSGVASDFTQSFQGVANSEFPGAVAPGVDRTIAPGSYAVVQAPLAGYTATFSSACSGTIAMGQTKNCTINNYDSPAYLKVVTTVINDNGGTLVASNFTSHLTYPLDMGFPGSATGSTWAFSPMEHILTQYDKAGYTFTIGGDCDATGHVTLVRDQTKTCTITNDDIAS